MESWFFCCAVQEMDGVAEHRHRLRRHLAGASGALGVGGRRVPAWPLGARQRSAQRPAERPLLGCEVFPCFPTESRKLYCAVQREGKIVSGLTVVMKEG